MLFKSQAEKDFQITAPELSEMDAVVSTCANIYAGRPLWVNGKDGVKTINFAKSLCSETARLTGQTGIKKNMGDQLCSVSAACARKTASSFPTMVYAPVWLI